jgi:hypothetical protein
VWASANCGLLPRGDASIMAAIVSVFRILKAKTDRLCGLVVRVPGCRTEIYCASCEVRIEFIYAM